MEVQVYGTRGSLPVAGSEFAKYGGNTTCLRVVSECLPSGAALVVDAGSGYKNAALDILKEGLKKIALLQTHYHWDHIQGLPFVPQTYIEGCHTHVIGPKEHGLGPLEVHLQQMAAPYFPVNFENVRHRFTFMDLEPIGTQVLAFHPVGGATLVPESEFKATLKVENGQITFGANTFGSSGRYRLSECLTVRMYKTVHPEYSVSYRFEERTTGRVFVFLTDHEVTPGWSADLLAHLSGADLLIQDAQYSQIEYASKVGWGHGTPEYAVQTALRAKVKSLGLTHHDPGATDTTVDLRVAEAEAEFKRLEAQAEPFFSVFGCYDGMKLKL